MIKTIEFQKKIYAIIVKKNFKLKLNSIKFFTKSNYSQQLGYMNRPKGYKIPPHMHKKNSRKVFRTQEVLFIKKGLLKINFYNPLGKLFRSQILSSGDIIMLAYGGHGFEMLKNSEILEVKQGPFNKSKDKIIF